MKEKWNRSVVEEWEIPAPGFDSRESSMDEKYIVLPMEIQDKFVEVKQENQEAKTSGSGKMSGLTILGPVEKDGRKVFVVRKVLYTRKSS